jgi:hypothetical protein
MWVRKYIHAAVAVLGCGMGACVLFAITDVARAPAACLQAGAFKIGDTAGTLDNIINCKLHRPGSVGFVSKSGGMSNEVGHGGWEQAGSRSNVVTTHIMQPTGSCRLTVSHPGFDRTASSC